MDGVFVGIGDLRLSMTGRAGLTGTDDATVDAALDAILDSARARGLKAGLFAADTDHAIDMIKRGYEFVTVMNDVSLMASAASAVVQRVRQSTARSLSPLGGCDKSLARRLTAHCSGTSDSGVPPTLLSRHQHLFQTQTVLWYCHP